MPFCEDCSRFWTPTSMKPDGSCPSCGRAIATKTAEPRAPWHFKLLVAAVIGYLAWRVVQGLSWLL